MLLLAGRGAFVGRGDPCLRLPKRRRQRHRASCPLRVQGSRITLGHQRTKGEITQFKCDLSSALSHSGAKQAEKTTAHRFSCILTFDKNVTVGMADPLRQAILSSTTRGNRANRVLQTKSKPSQEGFHAAHAGRGVFAVGGEKSLRAESLCLQLAQIDDDLVIARRVRRHTMHSNLSHGGPADENRERVHIPSGTFPKHAVGVLTACLSLFLSLCFRGRMILWL